MYFIPVFLFAFSANIDSFIIGISYGIKKTAIRFQKNILISLITLGGTTAALLSGSGILLFCPVYYADFVGRILLLGFGFYYLLKSLFLHIRKQRSSDSEIKSQEFSPDSRLELSKYSLDPRPESDDLSPNNGSISLQTGESQLTWKEAFFLGISLSANNLGIGISASITGLSVLPTAPVSFLFCVLFLYLGNVAGKSQIFQKAGRYADFFCGLLLIILGICQ